MRARHRDIVGQIEVGREVGIRTADDDLRFVESLNLFPALERRSDLHGMDAPVALLEIVLREFNANTKTLTRTK